MSFIRLFAILSLLPILLTGCGSTQTQTTTLTPMDFEANDPDDAALTSAIQQFVQKTGAPPATGYDYVRFDLNDDGRRDALVYLKSPYGYWCGIHGCALLIFKAHDEHFTLVNSVQPIRQPVYISTLKSKGWKNLVVRVSGRAEKAKDVAMLYDGRQYPSDPSSLPPFPKKNFNGYTRVFMRN